MVFKVEKIKYSKYEKELLNSIIIKETYHIFHIGLYGLKTKIKSCLSDSLNNSNKEINELLEIILRIINKFKIKNKADDVMVHFRVTDSNDKGEDFKIPRWHWDAYYSLKNPKKMVTSLIGSGTLLHPNTKKITSIDKKINDMLINNPEEYSKKEKKDPFYFRKLYKKNIDKDKVYQLKEDEAGIFIPKGYDLNGGLHSEPFINSSRIFMAVTTLKSSEVKILRERKKNAIKNKTYFYI